MNRRLFMLSTMSSLAALGMSRYANAVARTTDDVQMVFEPLEKSDEQWRSLLNEEQFDVLFEDDTEAPGSSPLNAEKRAGTYICAACYLPLFNSETKFESGTGWPSFYQAIAGHTETSRDWKLFIPRTEYHCARCGGHQGHIFDDGPKPTGKRWCNNGLALGFVPEDQPLPKLRG